MVRPIRSTPARRLAAALGLLAALAGCGGGIYIGWGDDGDRPPTVSMVANPALAQQGQTITLLAAAGDDTGIDRVEFFRLGADGAAALLGTDRQLPYQVQTEVPATSAATVRYFARAFDVDGLSEDSPIVTVTIAR